MANIYQSFGFLFAKASQKMQEEWRDWLDNHNLSHKELGFLLTISTLPGVTQKHVGQIQKIDRTSVTQLTDQLEEKGYVIRIRHLEDRRAYELHLTDSGTALVKKIDKHMKKVDERYFTNFSQDEITLLKQLLLKIMEDKTNE